MKRLPTIEEWKELQENCSWKWDEDKKGMTVTGKNGNSIFLPATGRRDYTGLYGAGSWGRYWSLSFNTYYPDHAYLVYFYSGSVYWDLGYRCYGFSVRPVTETKQKGFVDLRLPSGLLWAEENVEGYYTYDEAIKLFKKNTKNMEREEAIERIKTRFDKWALDEEDMRAIQTLVPELAESEDERIRKEILCCLEVLEVKGCLTPQQKDMYFNSWKPWLEKHKESDHLQQTLEAYKISDEKATAKMEGRLEGRQDVIENPEAYGLSRSEVVIKAFKKGLDEGRSENKE